MRRPLVLYDFATAPFWISLCMRKNFFSFLSVYSATYRPREEICYHWATNHLRVPTSSNQLNSASQQLLASNSCLLSNHTTTTISCRQPNCTLKSTSWGHLPCKIWEFAAISRLFSTIPSLRYPSTFRTKYIWHKQYLIRWKNPAQTHIFLLVESNISDWN